MANLSWLHFIILSLASFRLTRLFVYDQVTEFIRRPFVTAYQERESEGTAAGQGRGFALKCWVGALLSCHWCFGLWSSAVVLLLYTCVPAIYPILLVLAIAGAAAWLENRAF